MVAVAAGWLVDALSCFGVVLVGLIWFEIWAIGHRGDDG